MWAITDFTEENGATRLVPGSHLWRPAAEPARALRHRSPAEMAKGSVLVWVGSLWHGGGANRTDRRRVGIAMNYCAGWVRQQENQQLGIDRPNRRHRFPRRLQELVGYSVYNGLIGHIDKQHPAQFVLKESEGVDMVWDLLKPQTEADNWTASHRPGPGMRHGHSDCSTAAPVNRSWARSDSASSPSKR